MEDERGKEYTQNERKERYVVRKRVLDRNRGKRKVCSEKGAYRCIIYICGGKREAGTWMEKKEEEEQKEKKREL